VKLRNFHSLSLSLSLSPRSGGSFDPIDLSACRIHRADITIARIARVKDKDGGRDESNGSSKLARAENEKRGGRRIETQMPRLV